MPILSRVSDPNAPQVFEYVAVSATGSRVKAKMTANSPEAVAAALAADNWVVISVKEVATGGFNMDVRQLLGGQVRLDMGQVAEFARQFHQLLKAGLSVPKAVLAIGEEAEPGFSLMCSDIAQSVNNGESLSSALAKYPRAFDEVFCAYVHAGEQAGTLVTTTERLAAMLDKQSDIRKKIKGVTMYPKMVSIAIGCVVMGIMMFLVPAYANIYAQMGAKLPTPTQDLVAVSNIVIPIKPHPLSLFSWVPLVHGIFLPNLISPIYWGIVLLFVFRWWNRKNRNNVEIGTKLDKIKYRLPIFGILWKRMSLYRWSSTLAGALHSGVSMTESLSLAARASGSRWQLKVVPELHEAIRSGRPLSDALSTPENKLLYPPNIRKMIETGEVAGELDTMLDSVADALNSDIDAIVAGLSAKIEVALLMIMGTVVGTLLVILYMPILSLDTTIGNGLQGSSSGSGSF